MLETHAFFAMFAVLIATVAVMHMWVLTRFVRARTAALPDEYFAEVYPDVDRHESTEQFVSRYRLAHTAVAVLGLLLLGWFIGYMQRPDWDKRWVVFPAMGFFLLQWLPMLLTAVAGIRHLKLLRKFLMHAKRRAALKRRGLFDFVSPATVWLAALAYLLFIPFAIYLSRETAAWVLFVGVLTFDYALNAAVVYRTLYGRKSDPFETHSGRLYTMGLRVRSSIYGSLAVALFLAFTLTAMKLGLDRWMPFALAAFLTAITCIVCGAFTAPPHDRTSRGLDTSEVVS